MRQFALLLMRIRFHMRGVIGCHMLQKKTQKKDHEGKIMVAIKSYLSLLMKENEQMYCYFDQKPLASLILLALSFFVSAPFHGGEKQEQIRNRKTGKNNCKSGG